MLRERHREVLDIILGDELWRETTLKALDAALYVDYILELRRQDRQTGTSGMSERSDMNIRAIAKQDS